MRRIDWHFVEQVFMQGYQEPAEPIVHQDRTYDDTPLRLCWKRSTTPDIIEAQAVHDAEIGQMEELEREKEEERMRSNLMRERRRLERIEEEVQRSVPEPYRAFAEAPDPPQKAIRLVRLPILTPYFPDGIDEVTGRIGLITCEPGQHDDHVWQMAKFHEYWVRKGVVPELPVLLHGQVGV